MDNRKFPQWAVIPSLAPWHGDMRRDSSPYVLTGGISYPCLYTAQSAMRKLNAMGHSCHVDMVDS